MSETLGTLWMIVVVFGTGYGFGLIAWTRHLSRRYQREVDLPWTEAISELARARTWAEINAANRRGTYFHAKARQIIAAYDWFNPVTWVCHWSDSFEPTSAQLAEAGGLSDVEQRQR